MFRIPEFLIIVVVTLIFINHSSAQTLAVVSRGENKVAFISIQEGKIIGTTSTGSFPHEMVLDNESRFIYVPSYGGNRVSKIDILRKETVTFFEFGKHKGLHSIVVMNNSLWITSEENRALLEVDSNTGKIDKEWPTNGYRSHMVVSVPQLNKLYVANIDSGTVSIINPETRQTKIIKTGSGAEGIDVAPDGKEVWVSNRGENTISVIDTYSDSVIKKFDSNGDFPVKLKFNPNGKEVWVANNRSGTIGVFDIKNYSWKRNIEVGSRPLGITFSDDGTKGYITKPASNEVLEIDILKDYSITKSFKTLSSPDGVIWLPKNW